jgi:biopolymer transport protein ExbB
MSVIKSFSRSKFFWIAVAVFFVFVAFGPDGFAQDAADAAADATEAVDEQADVTLFDRIMQGGWAMVPLGLLSVAMITLIVYNLMQLTKGKFMPEPLRQGVLSNMSEVRVRSAIEQAADSATFYGRMMANSLPHVDATDPESLGREHVEDSIADFTVKEVPSYMAWVGYFSVIAQAAPMIGLLGTVSGMIKAFQTLGLSKGADPGALAANISEALVTTASGLVVAVPCLFCFYIFKNKLNGMVARSHEAAREAMDAAIATVNADQQLAKVPEGISEG